MISSSVLNGSSRITTSVNNNSHSSSTGGSPPPAPRRFVLFLGPAKTASTTLQSFFRTFANQESEDAVPAFQNWNYPLFLQSHAGLRFLNIPNKLPSIRKTFRDQDEHINIITGSEFLAIHERYLGGHLFETLQNWTGVQPEIVIMMRFPRIEQLVSIWKQMSQAVEGRPTYGMSFPEWFCNDKQMEHWIGRVTNPLQLAYDTVVHHNLSTTVIDMFGVSEAGLDISHVVSCEVMNVPCTYYDGHGPWVEGLGNATIRANKRSGRAHRLSPEKVKAMEWLFQQRDQAFFADLAHHPRLRLLHRHKGFWEQDEQQNGGQEEILAMDPLSLASTYRYDEKTLIQELRRIYGCHPTNRTEEILGSTTTLLLPNSTTIAPKRGNKNTATQESSETVEVAELQEKKDDHDDQDDQEEHKQQEELLHQQLKQDGNSTSMVAAREQELGELFYNELPPIETTIPVFGTRAHTPTTASMVAASWIVAVTLSFMVFLVSSSSRRGNQHDHRGTSERSDSAPVKKRRT